MRFFIYFQLFCFCFFCFSCSEKKRQNKPVISDSLLVNLSDSSLIDDTVNIELDNTLSESDSIRIAELKQASKVSAHGEISKTNVNNSYYLDNTGIGIVKIGNNAKALPSKQDGLYDKVKFDSNGVGGKVCLLYYNNEQILELDCDKKNIITSIRVTSPSIKTVDDVCQFMDFKSVIKLNNVRKVIGKQKTDDIYSFDINGIHYELEENIKGDNKFVSAIVVNK